MRRPAIVMGEAIENAHSAPCEERAAPLASSRSNEKNAASVGGASAQVQGAEAKLRALFAHWNEFGPEHGFGELIDRMQADSTRGASK